MFHPQVSAHPVMDHAQFPRKAQGSWHDDSPYGCGRLGRVAFGAAGRALLLCLLALACRGGAAAQETYFQDLTETFNPNGARAIPFSVNTRQTFIFRFVSDFDAEAAIITPATAQSFVDRGSYVSVGENFVSRFGTHSVTLAPGSYYLGARNRSNVRNPIRVELDYRLSVDGYNFYDTPLNKAERIPPNTRKTYGFTVQSGIKYFIDGCNTGLDVFIIDASQTDNFLNNRAFQYYYGGNDNKSYPGLWELKLRPGTYFLAMRNQSNENRAITYQLERWTDLAAPPPPPPPPPAPDPTPAPTPAPTPVPLPTATTIQFDAGIYQVNETAGTVNLAVTRTGNLSAASSVIVMTVDDPAPVRCDAPGASAYARCDYATAVETLRFGPGESVKSLTVSIIDDAHVESQETFQLKLTDPVGASLGAQKTATMTIFDNDGPAAANPIATSPFFVRMQYLDFLGREPEPAGFDAWLGVLSRCANPQSTPGCDRTEVSASFFKSVEFQLKGYFVYRFYKVSYGRLPKYTEIIPDMQRVTGQTGDEVTAKKAAFTREWMERPEFKALYPATLSDAAFVDKLLQTAGVTLSGGATTTRSSLISELQTGAKTRADALRAIVEHPEVDRREYPGAFVAMQYFGYLRRDPETDGYQAWLRVLNANPQDYRTMVNGFVNSIEYRLRFGDPNR